MIVPALSLLPEPLLAIKWASDDEIDQDYFSAPK